MVPAQSQIVLGTAPLGTVGERSEAYRLLDAFIDHGGRIIDTAAIYSDWVPGETGRSEAIIGEWLRTRSDRHAITVVTKGAHPPIDDMSFSRLDAASLQHDVEASLRRLGTGTLPLYFLHRDDVRLPVTAILEPLARMRDAGKIGALGVSNWSVERMQEAIASGVMPIASNQVFGNILVNTVGPLEDPTWVALDRAAMQAAEQADQSVFLFGSQGEGYFSRWIERPEAVKAHYKTPAGDAAARQIGAMADERGISPTALALQFLLAFSPRLFPIVGPRTVEQVKAAMAPLQQPLDTEALEALARISGFAAFR